MSIFFWNKFYKKKNFFFWPWTDLVTLINRFFKKKRNVSVFEIGVGNGANIPFYLSKSFNVFGVDRSVEAIKILKKRYPKIKNNFFLGDFLDIQNNKKKFDLIIDRGSISCGNDITKIKNIILLIETFLKKKGLFIGVDMYSKSSTYYIDKVKKINLKKNFFSFFSGPFKGMGRIFFFSLKDIKRKFKNFNIIHLEEKKIINYNLIQKKLFCSWMIVVKKK